MRWNILHERLHALHSSTNSLDFMSFDKAVEKKNEGYVKKEKENEKKKDKDLCCIYYISGNPL